jgi:3-hydroxyisobutyrate dehydrogenase
MLCCFFVVAIKQTTLSKPNNNETLSTQPSIGFIGLGQMGFHMAKNLRVKTAASASNFVIFDAFPATSQKFVETLTASNPSLPKAAIASTPRELASQCDIVVTMLPAGPHVKTVYLDGESGLLAGVKDRGLAGGKKALLVDSSTIDVKTSKEVAEEAKKAGAVMVDAPVSGGEFKYVIFLISMDGDILKKNPTRFSFISF